MSDDDETKQAVEDVARLAAEHRRVGRALRAAVVRVRGLCDLDQASHAREGVGGAQ